MTGNLVFLSFLSLCFGLFTFHDCNETLTNAKVKLTNFVLLDPVYNGQRYTVRGKESLRKSTKMEIRQCKCIGGHFWLQYCLDEGNSQWKSLQ